MSLISEKLLLIKSSERRPPSSATLLGPADVNDAVLVSLRLRRRPGSPPLPDLTVKTTRITPITRRSFAATYGAEQSDLDSVEAFAKDRGLTIVETDTARRTVVVSGAASQMQNAFGVRLNLYKTTDQTYRDYEGTVALPSALAEIVEGIYGLDNRRILQRIKMRKGEKPNVPTTGIDTSLLTPPEVARLYQFPVGSAFGQTIGILEFQDAYLASDLTTYFKDIGVALPRIVDVFVDGATLGSGSIPETIADIAIAGSVAPGATLVLYHGGQLTNQVLIDTLSKAVHDTANNPSVLSISYGSPELNQLDPGDQSALNAVSAIFQEAAMLGVTVFVASGDTGADWDQTDGRAHVSYPASDPGVTAVGGTVISNVTSIDFEEHTWPYTGGGISAYFAKPDWQANAGVPVSANGDGRVGRGVPDVAAHVGSYSFYVNGVYNSYSGTSCGAPLYAALVALINANADSNIGFLNANVGLRKGLYIDPSACVRDVADNVSNGSPGYTTGTGWDACTGFGSLRGAELALLLKSDTPPGVDPGRWQVTLVNKAHSETSGRNIITEIAGPLSNGSLWWISEADAINRLQTGTNSFFVQALDGSHSEVVVGDALPIHRNYLTTTPDGSKEDNLTNLPSLGVTIFG